MSNFTNSMQVYKNIIAGGCSFTSNGPGGLPPSLQHPEGACSFMPSLDYQSTEPASWAGILAKTLNVKSFVNVAASSHGNFLTANNILTLINNFDYTASDTLILFNLSDPARMDIMCDWKEHAKSSSCDWTEQILPHVYLNRNSPLVNATVKTMGYDQIELLTSNAICGLMSFLKYQGFDFYFTMMRDYRDNRYLGPVIHKFSEQLVMLSPGVGMYEHVKNLDLLADDNYHPNYAGHQSIASQVLDKVSEQNA